MEQIEEWRPVKGYKGYYEVSNLGRVRSLNYNHTKTTQILRGKLRHDGYVEYALNVDKKTKYRRAHQLVAEAFLDNPEGKPEIDHINRMRDDNRVENLRWVTKSENLTNPLTVEYKKSLFTPEKRSAASEAMMGEKNHFYGKKHSEESKAKMSASLKGRPCPEYIKERYREIFKGEGNPHYGKHHTEEAKLKIRAAQKKKQMRPVIQLSKDGRPLREFECMADAARYVGGRIGNIWSCCRSEYKTCMGYRWMYKEDYDNRDRTTAKEEK